MKNSNEARLKRRSEIRNKDRGGYTSTYANETESIKVPFVPPKRNEIIEMISIFGAPVPDYDYLRKILHFITRCPDLRPGTICADNHVLDPKLLKSLYDQIYFLETGADKEAQQRQIDAIIDSTYYLWQYRHYDHRLEAYLIHANELIFEQDAPLSGSWKQLTQMIRYLDWNDDPFDLGIDKYVLAKLFREHDYYPRLLGQHAAYALKLIEALPFHNEADFIKWKIDQELSYRDQNSGQVEIKRLQNDLKRLKELGVKSVPAHQIARQWLNNELKQLVMIRDLPLVDTIIKESALCEWLLRNNIAIMNVQAEIDRLEKQDLSRKILLGNRMCVSKQIAETEKSCYGYTLHCRMNR
jgi:hypothetical protein